MRQTGNRWMRKDEALNSAPYQALIKEGTALLKTQGYFSKDQVLEGSGMVTVGDSIRWDYLREFLEDASGVHLLCVSRGFFDKYVVDRKGKKVKRNGKPLTTAEHRRENPGHYLALGHGKKTFGFALMKTDGGVLAIKVLGVKNKIANGTRVAADNYKAEVKQTMQLPAPKRKQLAKPKPKRKR